MKILAPIDKIDEVDLLIDAGSDELYGGYIPAPWNDVFGYTGSVNKRTFPEAQFGSEQELAAAVTAIHDRGARFFLTLNNDFYSSAQMPSVLAEAERAARLGVDALIVADFGLMKSIRASGNLIEMHVSILAGVLNTRSAEFYGGLDAARIVLDRSLTPEQMARIVAARPGVDFEAFIMYGKCPNVEGLCTFYHHNDPKHVWPCGTECRFSAAGDETEAVKKAAVAQTKWASVPRGNACGLCGYGDLERAGLSVVKIAGRGRKTADKVAAVEAVAMMRRLFSEGAGCDEMSAAAKARAADMFGGPCDPYACYFPSGRGE